MFHYSLRVIHEPKMSEIRILNLCHKRMILVDIYRQSLLTVKIRRRIFLDFQLTLSYILESNLILWFLIREWNHAFGKKYMSKKKEGKRKENDPVLIFRVNLPETKSELCHSSPLQLGSSFFPLFYDILVSGTQTQGYKLVVKHVSHWYIKHVN